MTAFKLDFENTFDGGSKKVEDGTYEVVIEKAQEGATPSGAEYLDFWLRIRKDLKQAHGGMVIFHKIWKGKDSGKYHAAMINTLGKSAQLQNGKTYNGLDDLLNDFVGKPLKATVKNETSEYNGKTYENTNVKFTEKTEFPDVQNVETKQSANEAVSTIKDSDLPF